MGYLIKLVITLIVMVATCGAAWYVPAWAWTFGWIGASLCSVLVPLGDPAPDERVHTQALILAAGDGVIVTCDRMLTPDQIKSIKSGMLDNLPTGCKVTVLHGGLNVAAVAKAGLIDASIARLDAHNLT